MNTIETITIPETFQPDIHRAVQILKDAGCTEVYLFGSLARGEAREDSDIDLAVKGCPKQMFYRLYGRLLLASSRSVDLVRLDGHDRFAAFLQRTERLVKIA